MSQITHDDDIRNMEEYSKLSANAPKHQAPSTQAHKHISTRACTRAQAHGKEASHAHTYETRANTHERTHTRTDRSTNKHTDSPFVWGSHRPPKKPMISIVLKCACRSIISCAFECIRRRNGASAPSGSHFTIVRGFLKNKIVSKALNSYLILIIMPLSVQLKGVFRGKAHFIFHSFFVYVTAVHRICANNKNDNKARIRSEWSCACCLEWHVCVGWFHFSHT